MPVDSVSVLMGAVTETLSLERTIKELSSLPETALIREILIAYPPDRVSDGCRDTLKKAESFNNNSAVTVKVISQKTPGMGFFSDLIEIAEGTHCIPFPSDGAMPVPLIERFVEEEKKHPDAITSSSRWLPGCDHGGYGRAALIINKLSQLYLRILYNTKLTDLTNAVQIAPTELMKKIKWEENGFARSMEMVLKPLRLGVPIYEVPTDYIERSEGRSGHSFFSFFSYLIPSMRIRFMNKKNILNT